ncbi:uncharacterized protein FIBRA_07292 [Fibroporia radiculosa]|uniref:Uncharacterized protein n=1 Tax=Fibroporia radiculosa TaxID=599839 RepID=J4GUN2_9APHY|nr:uncharacterized protein FIBRA_07292 [Fibroporia radiculosa]CCM05085.1 predicted protein [Fibroporia radiculosa]
MALMPGDQQESDVEISKISDPCQSIVYEATTPSRYISDAIRRKLTLGAYMKIAAVASGWTFILGAIFGGLGMLVTYFFVPDTTGVDLANEDEKFLKYLADNGWHGGVGDEDAGSDTTESKLPDGRNYDEKAQ